LTLGTPLIATKGFASPEVGTIYARARELCQKAGDVPELFPVLWGLWVFYTARAEHLVALELAEQCLRMAEKNSDPTLLLEAHHALGITLTGLANFEQGLEHLNYVIAYYDQNVHGSIAFAYGQDPKVVCLSQAAWTTWLRGYPEQAQSLNDQAISLARKLSHPYTLAAALDFGAMVPQLCGNDLLVSEFAEEAIALSGQRDFALWQPWALLMQGWAMTQRGQFSHGIAQMRDAIAAFRTTGADVMVPYFLGLLAEAYGKAGQTNQALIVISEARALVDRGHECWWEPELYRLRGELILTGDDNSGRGKEAQECFLQAINIASRQQAKSLELRAVTSLCRLWQTQGNKAEGRRILADTHKWFEEGFETADLRTVKALLG